MAEIYTLLGTEAGDTLVTEASEGMIVQIQVDLDHVYYHKNARNPIVIHKGVFRALPGNVGEV